MYLKCQMTLIIWPKNKNNRIKWLQEMRKIFSEFPEENSQMNFKGKKYAQPH